MRCSPVLLQLLVLLGSLPAGGAARIPRQVFYDLSLHPHTPLMERMASPPELLFLNFEGATIIKAQGSDAHANISFLCGGSIPGFRHEPFAGERDQVIARVVDNVAALFADFALQIVTERPAAGPYDMVVIGGTPDLCGYPSGYSGMSHLDCSNAIPSDIALVFSDGITSLEMLAVVIAHEVAHGYGLPHSDEACDVMSNIFCADGRKRFLDREMGITPDHLGECGLASINSWEMLYNLLGTRPGLVHVRWPESGKLPISPRPLQIAIETDPLEDDPSAGGCQLAAFTVPSRPPQPLFVVVFFLVLLSARVREKS